MAKSVRPESPERPTIGLRFLAAVLAGSAVMLPVGFLLYGVLFDFLFSEGALTTPGVMRDPPDIAWIIAGQIPFGILLTLVIHWRKATTIRSGASTGAILGFLMGAGYDLAQYGSTHLWTLRATLVDPFISAALVGVAGGVVGAVLGGRDREAG